MTKKHFQQVIKIGSPLLAGMFIEYILYLADSVMIGRLGTEYLAAAAVGGLVAEMLWAFAWTTSAGTQTLSSRRFGRQDRTGSRFTGEIIENGIVFGLFAGVLSLFLSIAARTFLSALVESSTTVSLAMEYVSVIRWLMPITGVYFALYGFLAGINETKHLMYATIGVNLLNIGLNYLLIYGKAGFPAMGIKGAALGTLLAQSAGLVYFFVLFSVSEKLKQYGLFRWHRLKKSILKDIFRAWLPVTLQYIIIHGILLVYEGIISSLGTVYLAVFHIIFMINWLGKSVTGAFAEGGAILVGNLLGRDDAEEAKKLIYACALISLVIGCAVYIIAIAFPEILIRLFNSEPGTVFEGAKALRFFAPFFILGSFGFILEIIFSHNGWGRFVLISDVTANLIFCIAFAYSAVKIFQRGVVSAWAGFALYLTLYTLVLWAGFFSGRWAKIRVDTGAGDASS